MAKESLFANKGELNYALHSIEFIYLLIAKKVSGGGEEEFHPKLKALLEEFLDVFLEELPMELPPIWGIEHQINLIPGSTLPNGLIYRCNPEEAKELQWKIEELMERDYERDYEPICR